MRYSLKRRINSVVEKPGRWPSECWSSLTTEELTPPLITGVEELAPMVEELALSCTWGGGPSSLAWPTSRTLSWPTTTSTPSMTCRGVWRGWACGPITTRSPVTQATAGYLRGVSMRIEHWWCTRSHGPWARPTTWQWTFAEWTKGCAAWYTGAPNATMTNGEGLERWERWRIEEDFCLFCF